MEPHDRGPLPPMTMRFLLLLPFLATAAPAAVVLTNIPSAVLTTNLIKGTGGFITSPIEYGFEFTVGGGDHQLTTITLSIGTHFGTVPMTVELYGSPTGPDAATFITEMTGPAQPVNQLATYAPVIPTTLAEGGTYFLRLWVNGNASQYGIQRTATTATGAFTMGDIFTRSTGSPWGSGSHASETMVEIEASPVPEPAAAVLGCVGFMLLFRRRQW